MHHIDVEKWKNHPSKLARDADHAAADAERAQLAEQQRLEAEEELEVARLEAEARAELENNLAEAVFDLLDAAIALSNSGVHIYDCGRVAGRAVASRSRHSEGHPLGDRAGDFCRAMAEAATMGLG